MVKPEFRRLPLVVESTEGNYIISGGKNISIYPDQQ